MNEHRYFLRLEYATKVWFDIIKNDVGVKVFILSHMPEKFLKLNTETDIKYYYNSPESDKKTLKKLYKGCDVFFLNISKIYGDDDIVFDLSKTPGIVVAFVCIPKTEQGYKEQPKKYIEFVKDVLEDYYNESNIWHVFIADKKREKLPKKYVKRYALFILNNKFSKKDNEVFEQCKNKYNIPQSEIYLAKSIIKSYKKCKRTTYSITPEIMKKIHKKRHQKEQKNAE